MAQIVLGYIGHKSTSRITALKRLGLLLKFSYIGFLDFSIILRTLSQKYAKPKKFYQLFFFLLLFFFFVVFFFLLECGVCLW